MASLTRLGMASRERTGALMTTRLQSLHEHRVIVEALLRRDPDCAAEAMRTHLVNIRKSLRASSGPCPTEDIETPTGGDHVADHNLG